MVKNITLGGNIFALKQATSIHSNNSRKMKNHGSLVDEIIELNVGGQKITTLHSTLTAVPNSKLALMFSKNDSKKTLLIDKQSAVFFDYNPIYFNYILDRLRTIKRMPKESIYQVQFAPPFTNSQVNFTHMLVDLGLTRKYF